MPEIGEWYVVPQNCGYDVVWEYRGEECHSLFVGEMLPEVAKFIVSQQYLFAGGVKNISFASDVLFWPVADAKDFEVGRLYLVMHEKDPMQIRVMAWGQEGFGVLDPAYFTIAAVPVQPTHFAPMPRAVFDGGGK